MQLSNACETFEYILKFITGDWCFLQRCWQWSTWSAYISDAMKSTLCRPKMTSKVRRCMNWSEVISVWIYILHSRIYVRSNSNCSMMEGLWQETEILRQGVLLIDVELYNPHILIAALPPDIVSANILWPYPIEETLNVSVSRYYAVFWGHQLLRFVQALLAMTIWRPGRYRLGVIRLVSFRFDLRTIALTKRWL